ncbi:hypothetical protein MFIFM68171_00006 [Madurella fahalii]|uniref:Helicase C-terminal domain-containing protein n=1 Tax=Madurella fahalii TaxID=1157608 RepID=A0ABQ0FWB1_9PEZI
MLASKPLFRSHKSALPISRRPILPPPQVSQDAAQEEDRAPAGKAAASGSKAQPPKQDNPPGTGSNQSLADKRKAAALKAAATRKANADAKKAAAEATQNSEAPRNPKDPKNPPPPKDKSAPKETAPKGKPASETLDEETRQWAEEWAEELGSTSNQGKDLDDDKEGDSNGDPENPPRDENPPPPPKNKTAPKGKTARKGKTGRQTTDESIREFMEEVKRVFPSGFKNNSGDHATHRREFSGSGSSGSESDTSDSDQPLAKRRKVDNQGQPLLLRPASPKQRSTPLQDPESTSPVYYELSSANLEVIPRLRARNYPAPPLPEKDKRKQPQSKCWTLGMDCSWRQRNLDLIDGLEPKPHWWDFDFEPQYHTKPHPTQSDMSRVFTMAKETYDSLAMSGLTIMQALSPEGRGDTTHQCGVLGFKSIPAMNTWLDTQAGTFLGPLNRYMVCNTSRTNANNLKSVFEYLKNVKGDRYSESLLSQIAKLEQHRTWIIRNGDLGQSHNRSEVHYNMTILANLLMMLKFATTGRTLDLPCRFEQKFDEHGEDLPGRMFGFTVDDWFRAVYALLVFRYRRSAGLYLDTPKGIFKQMGDLGYWEANVADSQNLLSAEDHSKVPENALALYGMEVIKFVRSFPEASVTRPKTMTKTQLLAHRLNTRARVLLQDNPAISLSRRHAKRARGARGTRRRKGGKFTSDLNNIIAMDSKLLDALLKKLEPNFLPPRAAIQAKDVIKSFGGLTARDQIEDFLSTQDAFATELATIEARHKRLDKAEVIEEVRQLISNTAAVSNMVSRHENPPVDMVAAAMTVGIPFEEVSDIDWKKLHVPGTAKDFNLMPHQLADAYSMWLAEQTPIPCTILGNDVGLGKTSTALALVAMDYFNCLRCKEDGTEFTASPTIMFEPPNLVAQVFNEIMGLWGKFFTVVVAQGDAKSHGGNTRLAQAAELGADLPNLINKWKKQTNNPETCRIIVITSLSTFRARFVQHTSVQYYSNSIAAKEPWNLDIINTEPGRQVNVRTREHLNLLKIQVKNGQLRLKPALANKILKVLADEQACAAMQERAKMMRQRSYLKRKERKLKEAKRAKKREAEKAKKREIRARHKAKAASKRKAAEQEEGSGDESGEETQPPKKQKTGTGPKSKPASKNKSNKGKEAEDGAGSGSESSDSDFDEEDYNYVDADISSDESDDSDDEGDEDDQVASALNDVLNQLESVNEGIQERDELLDARNAGDMWEALGAIPPGMEAEFHDEIKKRIKIQEQYLKDRMIRREKIAIKCYILSLPLDGFQFSRVIVDEAQSLRNIESGFSRIIRLMTTHTRALHMMSATPTLNKIDDISVEWAYAAEIYQPYGKFVPPKSFIMSRTEIRELQSKVQAERDAEKDSAIDSAVFENEKYSDKRLRDYYERTGKRELRPGLQGHHGLSPPPPLPSDPLETPDGTMHYPREHMPGLRVRVEELGYADKTAATIVATVTTELLRSLYTIRNTNDSNEVIVNPEMGDGGEQSEDGGNINMTIVRALWMVAMDLKSYRVMQLDDRTSLTREDVLIQGISQAVKLGSVSEREEFKARATSDGEPHLGAQHTEYLRDRDIDGGLSYLFAMLCQDNSVTVPSDRNGMAHFVMYESPVLHRVATLVHQNKKEGERTLVVVNNPWMQQLTHALLDKLSFSVASIRASHTSNERERIVELFNNPASNMDCLVLNMSLSSAGLNLHKCCCRGIILQYPWNWPTIHQTIGRISRIGGKKIVDWVILHVTGTMYDVMEDKINRKYCEQLRLEARIPAFIKSIHLQRMVAYEIIKMSFGQPFNRYSDTNRTLGHIFSTIVSKIVNLPDQVGNREVPEILDRIENIVPQLAAFIRRNPRDLSLLEATLEEIWATIDSIDFDDEELGYRVPWWFERAAIKDTDWSKDAPIDLDAILVQVGDVVNRTSSAEQRQKGEEALCQLLGMTKQNGDMVIAPKNIRQAVMEAMEHPLCSQEVRDLFVRKIPGILDMDLAPVSQDHAAAAPPEFPPPPSAVKRFLEESDKSRKRRRFEETPVTPTLPSHRQRLSLDGGQSEETPATPTPRSHHQRRSWDGHWSEEMPVTPSRPSRPSRPSHRPRLSLDGQTTSNARMREDLSNLAEGNGFGWPSGSRTIRDSQEEEGEEEQVRRPGWGFGL